MNRAMIVGNLVRDPEYRTTASGVSVGSFTVAVNRRFTNQNGEREADYIPVVVWRQTADACASYLRKGSKVAVCGSIQTRSYEAQDGSKRFATELVADEVEFLSKTPENGKYAPYTQDGVPGYRAQKAEQPMNGLEPVAEEDLPF